MRAVIPASFLTEQECKSSTAPVPLAGAVDGFIRPTPIELATGWLFGEVPSGEVSGGDGDHLQWKWLSAQSPRSALEGVVLRGLQRPPCVIDFSGGRDSSLVLAVATHVARREGLPLPIPRSNRFPLDRASNEDEWQELVVRHLRLDDWEVSNVTTELDVIGERARACLRKYGLMVPERLYTATPSLERASGGSYMTGEGGDEVLDPRRGRFLRATLGAPKAVLTSAPLVHAVVRNLAPRPVRFAFAWSDFSKQQISPWLKPTAARRFKAELARARSKEPLTWRAFLQWHPRRRVPYAIAHNLTVIARDYNVLHLQPLLDSEFLASLARCGGTFGFGTRTDVMTFLAQDLLPPALLGRATKPGYNTAYFTDVARAFAQSWDGSGVDESLVYPEKLKADWLEERPSAAGFALLQAAWLSKFVERA